MTTSGERLLDARPTRPAGARIGLRRAHDVIPIAYLTLIYGFLFWAFFRFTAASLPVKLALLWIGAVLATRTEAILHWTTHFPAFHSRLLNLLHRLYYGVLPRPALWYAHHHFQHHRYDNGPRDISTTLDEAGREHLGLLHYIRLSLLGSGDVTPVVDRMSRASRSECVVSLCISGAIAVILAIVDWKATLLFWIPVAGPLSMAMNVYYNYTDHVPSDPGHALRYATYDPLRTPYHRFLSWLDLHNIATHITHHRHPAVYWSDLPAMQEKVLDTYEAAGTPRTYALDSAILFNPLALLLSAWRVNRDRRALAVTVNAEAVVG